MRINQNITAFNAYRNLSQTQNSLSSSLEKLSSGFRINRAADDASGLVNSENLRSQIGGLKVATRNAQDAISLVQTAEGAQTEVHSILQRMRDLTVQSGNLGTNDSAALKANQDEIAELKAELTRIADQTQFGTKKILNGDFVKLTENAGADAVIEGGATTFTAADDAVFELEMTYNGRTETLSVDWDGGGDNDALVADVDAAIDAAFGSDHNIVVAANDDGNGLKFTVAHGTYADGDEVETLAVGANADLGLVEASAETELEVTEAEAAENAGAVFQVGANDTQQESVGMSSVSAEALGVADIDVNPAAGLDQETVDEALTQIDDAISTVSENRATLGAFQNRMESTIRNVSVAVENLSAAESRIRDTDMASEMVEFTRNQILSQAGTSMLAQANMVPQSVLSLLG